MRGDSPQHFSSSATLDPEYLTSPFMEGLSLEEAGEKLWKSTPNVSLTRTNQIQNSLLFLYVSTDMSEI